MIFLSFRTQKKLQKGKKVGETRNKAALAGWTLVGVVVGRI
jgi:hypothetical protein